MRKRCRVSWSLVWWVVTISLILPSAEPSGAASTALAGHGHGSRVDAAQRLAVEQSFSARAGEGISPIELSRSPLANPARVQTALASSNVMFIENVGQFDDGARFQVRGGGGGGLWLAGDALWLTLVEPPTHPAARPGALAGADGRRDRAGPGRLGLALADDDATEPVEQEPRRGVNLRLSFVDANPHPRIEPFNRLETVVSYFIGNDPDQWRPAVPVWGGVRYVDLYPGIDLVVQGKHGRWRWQLIVKDDPSLALSHASGAHADTTAARLASVRLQVEGADAVTLGDTRPAGVLQLQTAIGNYALPLLPVVDHTGAPVASLKATGFAAVSPLPTVGEGSGVRGNTFHVVAPFAAAATADEPTPVHAQTTGGLAYSTFLGGGRDSDGGYGIAVDSAGNAYITGGTSSSDFPTTAGAFDRTLGGYGDVFVTKLNASGSGLGYSTFLGGAGDDWGNAIAVDSAGHAYVTGYTGSSDFPTTAGAFDRTPNGVRDAFVTKLNASGSGLGYSTFLGGRDWDVGWGIAVDSAGHAYVTGYTWSSDFPTTAGAFDQTHNGSFDAFVTKLNASGSGLGYSTFLGGAGDDRGNAIAVDSAGHAYVTGETWSSDFPTTAGAFDRTHNGGWDAFVTKLNASGSGLGYSTFLGGRDWDVGRGIAVDSAGSAYVTGRTWSSDFPTTAGAFDQTHNGGWDAFVTKLNASGSGLGYSTFLGGAGDDRGNAIAVDSAGHAYVTGETWSSDFPTTAGAFDQTHNGGWDAFVTKLNASGSGLGYSTFLGGAGDDRGNATAVDSAGNAYVTGVTDSSDFPTTAGAFDRTLNGYSDVFVTKLALGAGGDSGYAVSGRVRDVLGNPVAGVIVSTATGRTATTDASGRYVLTDLPLGTHVLTPAKSGYFFSPPARIINIPLQVSEVNFMAMVAPGLRISHIEVTQVIQDQENSVPLIAGKPTLVRVYVDCGQGCSLPRVTGSLEVSGPGGTGYATPRRPGIIVAEPVSDWTLQRGSLDKTLNFIVPPELLRGSLPSTVTFTATVGSAVASTRLTVQAGKKLRIAWTPVPYEDWLGIHYPDESTVSASVKFLRTIYPLSAADLEVVRQPWLGLRPTSTLVWPENVEYYRGLLYVWQMTTLRQEWEGGRPPDRLYGLVSTVARGNLSVLSAHCGAAWTKGSGYTGRVAHGVDRGPFFAPDLCDETVLAHEIAHLLNDTELKHAPCGLPEDDDFDRDFRPANGSIGDWGYDSSSANQLLSPQDYWDFMSYCYPKWISVHNYKKLMQGFIPPSMPEPRVQALSGPERLLLVSGMVYTPAITATLDLVHPITSTHPAPPSSGEAYCLEARSESNKVLESRCFDLAFLRTHSSEPADRAPFVVAVPYPADARSLVLSHLGSELTRMNTSESPPTVQVTSPNGGEIWGVSGTYTITWSAADPDGDDLRFAVSYSPDNGATWQQIAFLVGSSFVTIDAERLPGSEQALIKVEATDGANIGSDISNAPFAVGRKAPQVYLLSPTAGITVPVGAPVVLDAYAYDPEDKELMADAVQWTSSIDGVLGVGNSLEVAMSAGHHVITATVTDSDGNTVSETSTIYVVDLQPPHVDAMPDAGSGTRGGIVTYTVLITNTSNIADSFIIEQVHADWSVEYQARIGPIASGEAAPVVVTVSIPITASLDVSQVTSLRVASLTNPAVAGAIWLTTAVTATGPRLYLPHVRRSFGGLGGW